MNMPSGSNIDVHDGAAGTSPTAMIDRLDQYPGGKNAAGTYHWLISLMPTHAVYVEGCVGSGALLRRKAPALCNVLIDTDPRVVDYWRRRKFPGSTIITGDVVPWLETHADQMSDDWLIYLDPPYRLDTRSHKRLYSEEWGTAKHNRLLAILQELPAQVMISGYATPEYALALGDWHHESRSVITRGGVLRRENIWCNFAPGSTAAPGEWDGPYPGRDFRERERIKKKLRRWRRLYLEMPDYERRAFLRQLLDLEAAQTAGNIDASGDEVRNVAHGDSGRPRRAR